MDANECQPDADEEKHIQLLEEILCVSLPPLMSPVGAITEEVIDESAISADSKPRRFFSVGDYNIYGYSSQVWRDIRREYSKRIGNMPPKDTPTLAHLPDLASRHEHIPFDSPQTVSEKSRAKDTTVRELGSYESEGKLTSAKISPGITTTSGAIAVEMTSKPLCEIESVQNTAMPSPVAIDISSSTKETEPAEPSIDFDQSKIVDTKEESVLSSSDDSKSTSSGGSIASFEIQSDESSVDDTFGEDNLTPARLDGDSNESLPSVLEVPEKCSLPIEKETKSVVVVDSTKNSKPLAILVDEVDEAAVVEEKDQLASQAKKARVQIADAHNATTPVKKEDSKGDKPGSKSMANTTPNEKSAPKGTVPDAQETSSKKKAIQGNESNPQSLNELHNQSAKSKQTENETSVNEVIYSSLSREEHREFLSLSEIIHSDPKAPSGTPSRLIPTQMARFAHLLQAARAEQERYKEYVKAETLKRTDVYLFSNQHVMEHVKEYIKERKLLFTSWYPRKYLTYSVIGLQGIQPSPTDPVLRFSAAIKYMGKCLWVEPPRVMSTIPTNIPVLESESGEFNWKKKVQPPVSLDPNCRDIVQTVEPDIVISSSALRTLIDLQPPFYPRQFNIPVRVETLLKPGENQTLRKVVYIDKPLLPQKLTMRDKNQIYYKLAFEAISLKGVCRQYAQTPVELTPQQTEQSIGADAEPSSESSSAHQPKNVPKVKIEQDNLLYNVWMFGDIKVLIRCKVHGGIADPSTPKGIRYVGIQTKLEYLKNQGWEEDTISELARWWIYSFIRPDAHLYIGRIDPTSSVLLSVERRGMTDIITQHGPFQPPQYMKQILVIFQKLRDLPVGSYILQHEGNSDSIAILKNIESEHVVAEEEKKPIIDLHQIIHSSGITDRVNIPYIPVKWVPSNDQIPYTFPHTPTPTPENICYIYAMLGSCSKGKMCKYIHLKLPRHQWDSFGITPHKHHTEKSKKRKKANKKRKRQAAAAAASNPTAPSQ